MTRQEFFTQIDPIIEEMKEKHRFQLEQKENEIIGLKWEIEALKKHTDQIWKLAVDRIAEEMMRARGLDKPDARMTKIAHGGANEANNL